MRNASNFLDLNFLFCKIGNNYNFLNETHFDVNAYNVCSLELVSKIDKSAKEYIISVNDLSSVDKNDRFNQIHDMFEKAKVLSDDKVQLAMQTYEMVDKHIRRLDTELTKFDNDFKEKHISSKTTNLVNTALPTLMANSDLGLDMAVDPSILFLQFLLKCV